MNPAERRCLLVDIQVVGQLEQLGTGQGMNPVDPGCLLAPVALCDLAYGDAAGAEAMDQQVLQFSNQCMIPSSGSVEDPALDTEDKEPGLGPADVFPSIDCIRH